MKYKAILFDFDYTLGDSTKPIVYSFTQALTKMGWAVPDQQSIRRTVGHTLQDAYTMLTGDVQEEKRQEFYQCFRKHALPIMMEQTVLCPGTPEVLEWLRKKDITVGIVSTKSNEQLNKIFTRFGLREHLALIIGGENVTRAKPDPEGLNLALSRLGMEKEQVLFCGDTIIDAKTAQAAGVDFCAVLNGTTTAEEFENYPHVHISPQLEEFLAWAKQL